MDCFDLRSVFLLRKSKDYCATKLPTAIVIGVELPLLPGSTLALFMALRVMAVPWVIPDCSWTATRARTLSRDLALPWPFWAMDTRRVLLSATALNSFGSVLPRSNATFWVSPAFDFCFELTYNDDSVADI